MRSKEVLLVATSKPSARLVLNHFYNPRTNSAKVGFSGNKTKINMPSSPENTVAFIGMC